MNRIITISREFGSGGRTIGRRVADELCIPCYDSEIIEKIVVESGFAKEYIQATEESYSTGYLFSRQFGPANEDILWNAQRKVIMELAEEGPCVIVGRCADFILRDKADLLTCFIHASEEFRANRIVEEYGEREDSPIKRIKEKDKRRAAYHRFYTDDKWGAAKNYDICLDSERLGIESCTKIITSLYSK